MFDRRVLKDRAKYVLSRSFLISVLACAIVSIVSGGMLSYNVQRLQGLELSGMSDLRIVAIYGVAGLMMLVGIGISIFVAAPLNVGLKYFMLLSADMDTNLENLLYPFKNNYRNIVWVTFVKNVYIFLWSLLCAVPMAIVIWKFNLIGKVAELLPAVQNESITATLSLMTLAGGIFAFTLVFTIPAFIKSLQYSQVEYILAENPDAKRSDVIGKSKEMMVGNKWAYVKLGFSFVGWYLIANFSCCIGNLLLAPYIEATFAQMYMEISGQGKDYSEYSFRNPFGGFENM